MNLLPFEEVKQQLLLQAFSSTRIHDMQGVAGVSLSVLVDTLRFYHWVPVILISFWKAKIAM